MVQTFVPCNSIQPRGKTCSGFIPAAVSENFHENLLEEILCSLAVMSEHPQKESEDPSFVPLKEEIECRSIAASEEGHEFFIFFLFHMYHPIRLNRTTDESVSEK
jgi:hypothetical protein